MPSILKKRELKLNLIFYFVFPRYFVKNKSDEVYNPRLFVKKKLLEKRKKRWTKKGVNNMNYEEWSQKETADELRSILY